MTMTAPVATTTPFLERIADELGAAGVRYCQWKGHFKQARWMLGDGDIDLLVAPEWLTQMLDVLQAAGFRQTTAPEDYRLLGTAHYRAPEPGTDRMIHVHVHTRLLVEAARGTVYRLPVEEALLASSGPGTLFPTPAAELEALVFVLRTTLRWASWRRVPGGTREELRYLEGLTDSREILDSLGRHLPAVEPEVFLRCRRALDKGATLRQRWSARRGLTRALASFSRSPSVAERVAHAAAAAAWHLRGGPRRYSLARVTTGGIVLALSGTDGSGKSTCARALAAWLRPHVLLMRAHVGRPPRSLLTLVVGALRRLMPLPQLEWLRQLCTARDRYRLVVRAWRFALDGGIALTERYPLGPDHALVGPRIRELAGPNPSALARRLAALEEAYYRRLPTPDLIFVLDVEPDVAVRRKTDEPADYVRARAEAMQKADWSGTSARIIDASRPLEDVIDDLRMSVWEAL